MRGRFFRRDILKRKYISRIKKRLYCILIKDPIQIFKVPESWREAEEKEKWVKMLKHNHVYGRSTQNVLEKHYRVKHIRSESKKIERSAMCA